MPEISITDLGDKGSSGAAKEVARSDATRNYLDVIPRSESPTPFTTDVPTSAPADTTFQPEQADLKTNVSTQFARSSEHLAPSVTEGLAIIRIPIHKTGASRGKEPNAENKADSKIPAVFYNPIQQFNRDLSVLAVRAFSENLNLERKLQLERRSLREGAAFKKGKKRKREGVSGDATAAPNICSAAVSKQESLEALLKQTVPDNWEFGRLVGPKEVAYPQPEPRVTRTKGHCIREYLHKVLPEHESYRLKLWDQPVTLKGDKFVIEECTFENETVGRLQLCTTSKPGFPLRILDALSATGLRAIRYAKEVPVATQIVANDLSASAVAAIQTNIVLNNVIPIVGTSKGNAQTVMYEAAASEGSSNNSQFHVIDLDPYGSAASFLDSAVQALADGGLLCVTCTDAGVFASVAYLEKTFSQYGGLPVKGAFSHEAGLRIILHAIATAAARYGIAIEPLLSLSVDFYARLFVRVRKSPAEVKLLASKTMMVYNCDHGCNAWKTQHLTRSKPFENAKGETLYKHSLSTVSANGPSCEHCGFRTHVAGPMWGGPIHNPAFIQKILDLLPNLDSKVYATVPRIEGMLTLARDEALLNGTPHSTEPNPGTSSISDEPPKMDKIPFAPLPAALLSPYPFFVIPTNLARTLHAQAPSDNQFRGALRHLGYHCTASHCKAGSIITDAPWEVIWEVMREWARKTKARVNKLTAGTAGAEIWRRGAVSSADENTTEEQRQGALENISILHQKKTELKGIVARAPDADSLRTQLEAFLYRLDPSQHSTSTSGTLANQTMSKNGGGSSTPASFEASQLAASKDVNVRITNDKKEIESKREVEPPLTAAKRKGIIFDEKLGADAPKKGKVRYQVNPRPDWGPMSKAGR